MGGSSAGSSSGMGGSSSGAGGSSSGAGGSSAGSAGSSAGTGGTSSCEGPTGDDCDTASDYCAGYPYVAGDLVVEVCTVGTAGCISGRTMVFECISACDTHSPATIVDNQYWKVDAQCP
jgi:hypothetical protein